jgi:hypothetical protein
LPSEPAASPCITRRGFPAPRTRGKRPAGTGIHRQQAELVAQRRCHPIVDLHATVLPEWPLPGVRPQRSRSNGVRDTTRTRSKAVGRGVITLAGISDVRADRREEHEEVEINVPANRD